MQILASLGGTIHRIWFFALGSGRFDPGHGYWHLIRNMCPRKITAVASSESIDIDWYWLDWLDCIDLLIDIDIDIEWSWYSLIFDELVDELSRIYHESSSQFQNNEYFSETFFGIATTGHLFIARYGALLSLVGHPPGVIRMCMDWILFSDGSTEMEGRN